MGDKITIQEFQKMDVRVGTIVDAEVPDWSHYVMKLKVDLGKEIGERKIFAGIMNFYKPKEIVGKQSLFIVNLEPKKIGPVGDYSEGMMLMATPTHEASNSAKALMDKTAGDATPTHEASNSAKALMDKTAGDAMEEELPPVFLSPKKKVPNGTKIM